MSSDKKPRALGITGMPGGGTHSAAALHGILHENGADPLGFADYLIHVPQHLWKNDSGPPRRAIAPNAPSTQFEFAKKLCVVRDPLSVVTTNLGIAARGAKFMRWLNLRLPNPVDTALPIIDFAVLVTLAWYHEALTWATDGHFVIEGTEQHRYPLPGPRMTPAEVFNNIKSPAIREQVALFRRKMGYDDVK